MLRNNSVKMKEKIESLNTELATYKGYTQKSGANSFILPSSGTLLDGDPDDPTMLHPEEIKNLFEQLSQMNKDNEDIKLQLSNMIKENTEKE